MLLLSQWVKWELSRCWTTSSHTHTHLIPSAQTDFRRPQVTQTYSRITASKINVPHVSSPARHRSNTEARKQLFGNAADHRLLIMCDFLPRHNWCSWQTTFDARLLSFLLSIFLNSLFRTNKLPLSRGAALTQGRETLPSITLISPRVGVCNY